MLLTGLTLLFLSAVAFRSYCNRKEQQRQRRHERWLYEYRRSPGVADP